jgi:hypothetical protein
MVTALDEAPGLERAPASGWSDPFTVASFVVAAILLIVFVLVETRSADALLPMRFLRNRRRVAGYAIMLLLGAAMLSLLYFLTQFLQDILHYSPLAAGVAYLPLPMVVGTVGLVVCPGLSAEWASGCSSSPDPCSSPAACGGCRSSPATADIPPSSGLW